MSSPPHPASTAHAYRRDIDGLRAIAVLAVLGYHAFPQAVPGGLVGVDVFFVISGFLITGIILDGQQRAAFSLSDFYVRRVRRIFPALIVVLAAAMAIGWWVQVPGDYATLGRHVVAGAAFVSNIVLWREADYFDAAAMFKPLLHLWSLAIEEQFYLLWPPLLALARRLRVDTWRMTVVVAVTSFAASLWLLHASPTAAFYLPLTRFWELLLGGALAHRVLLRAHGELVGDAGAAHRAGDARSAVDATGAMREAMAAVGLLLIGLAVFAFDDASAFPGWRALLPTVGAALLIAAGTHTRIARRVLSTRALVGIGLISYPLYLWHWPLLSFARIDAGDEVSVALRWALLALSLLLAWATWRLVERPFRTGHLRARAMPLLTGAMLIVAGVGGALWWADGIASRAGEPVRRYANYSYPFREPSREGRCSLVDASQPVAFPSECVDADTGDGRPLVVLWGDSHAAMLYPGMRAIAGQRFRLAQFTRSGCRPFVGDAAGGYERCREGNAWTLEAIQRLKPDDVVLFSHWNYNRFRSGEDMLQLLEPTIAALKRAGVPRIVVMGPAPKWKGKLPANLIKLYVQRPFLRVPERTRFALDPAAIELEAFLQQRLGARTDIRYFSVMRALCDARGCLTYVDGNPDVLTTWDYGHLSAPAAANVAAQLASTVDDFAPVARERGAAGP